MELKDIVSVTGAPGVYKVIAPTKNGFIVESLIDGKRTSVTGTQTSSNLADIAVFTTDEDLLLGEVFKKVNELKDTLVDAKSDDKTLREFFKKVVPDYDESKVYPSHIKKIISWYNLLKDKIDFSKVEEPAEGEAKGEGKEDHEKPIHKAHEGHGPKTNEHGMTKTVKTRKKV
jgi:hypothetical protein